MMTTGSSMFEEKPTSMAGQKQEAYEKIPHSYVEHSARNSNRTLTALYPTNSKIKLMIEAQITSQLWWQMLKLSNIFHQHRTSANPRTARNTYARPTIGS